MIFLPSVEPYFVAKVVTKISSCRVIVVCRQSEVVMEPPTPKEVFLHHEQSYDYSCTSLLKKTTAF